MLILAACIIQTVAAATCTVYVRGIVGVVEVYEKDDTDWDDAELNQCLQIGDKIRTGKDGNVSLDFTSRADVSLNALSQFQISSSSSDSSAADQGTLSLGTAWAKAQKSRSTTSSSFSIKTPSAVAGVRGTEFDVEVDELGDSDINVTEGEVDITNEFGESKAGEGDGVRVRRGKRPDQPGKIDIKEHKKKLGLWKDKIKRGQDLGNDNQRLHKNRKKNKDRDKNKENEPDKKPKGGKHKKNK
jgi:hypothetical protein